MEFIFITLFPEMIEQASRVSIIGRAVEQGLVSVTCINPRDYATDRHRSVDALIAEMTILTAIVTPNSR